MRTFTPIVSFIILLAFAGSMHKVYGLDQDYNPIDTALYNGNIATDSIVSAEDPKFSFMNSNLTWGFTNDTAYGEVYVKIRPHESDYESAFTYRVQLEVKYRTHSGNAGDSTFGYQTKTCTLEVSYDPTAATNYQDYQNLIVGGAYRIQAKVLAITDENDTPITGSPNNLLEIGAKGKVVRYYDAEPTFMVANLGHTGPNSTSEMTISWDSKEGVEAYDLEWTYIDNYDGNGGTLSASDISFTNATMDRNATRVRLLGDNSYDIPLIYGEGYLIYRVRPIWRVGDDHQQIFEGRWSSHNDYGSTVFQVTDKFLIQSTHAHEADLNWQYTAAYAEEGKRKEVVKYFDGTLRERQAVTKLNNGLSSSDDVVMVGEQIYDHHGRPVVDILPAPAPTAHLKYYEKFNQNTAGNAYSKADFNLDNGSCLNPVGELSLESGAGLYYGTRSATNNRDTSGRQGYVPDAKGYGFTVKQYTADQTGRIRQQSGVGSDHSIGNDGGKHTTRYYYAQPDQEELDRLFGTEIGYHTHYKKIMTIDPNGQASITYQDLSGKTLATGLAGPSPDNLSALDNYKNATVQEKELIGDNEKIENPTTGLYALEVQFPFLVTEEGIDTLAYSFTPEIFEESCLSGASICIQCEYALTISVTDECGNVVLTGDQAVERTITGSPDQICESPLDELSLGHEEGLITKLLSPGQYTVVKTLQVDQSAAEFYADLYMANSWCFLPFSSFRQQVLDSLNIDEQCEVDTIIPRLTTCAGMLEVLKADLTPGGQYAEYEYTSNGNVIVSANTHSILNASNTLPGSPYYADITDYKDEDGNAAKVMYDGVLTDPQDLPVGVFIENFSPSWADAMVEHHPEYCYYQHCMDEQGSASYDSLMRATNTFEEAWDLGLLNPLGLSNQYRITDTAFAVGYINDTDPFFRNDAGPRQTQYDSMENSMLNYKVIGDSTLSMWQLAYAITACDADDVPGIVACWNSEGLGANCNNDRTWHLFRGMYLSEKQRFFEQNRDAYAETNNCSNEDIGVTDDRNKRFISIYDFFDFDPYTYDDTTTAINQANNDIEAHCDTMCNSYAEYWLNSLSGCALDSALSDSIVMGMVAVCKLGCDENNPLGASTAPASETTIHGHASFEDVLIDWIPGYDSTSPSCSADLISQPLPYEHNYLGGNQQPWPVLDTCACNWIIDQKAQYDAAMDLPAYILSFPDFVAYNTGLSGELIDEKLCACEDYQVGESGAWMVGANDSLLARQLHVPASITCPDCIECTEFQGAMSNFIAKYGAGVETDTNYYKLLTNYLNRQFGFNLDYISYIEYNALCEEYDTSSVVVIDDYPVIISPGDSPSSGTGAVVIGDNGGSSGGIGSTTVTITVDPIAAPAEIINVGVGPIIDDMLDHIYYKGLLTEANVSFKDMQRWPTALMGTETQPACWKANLQWDSIAKPSLIDAYANQTALFGGTHVWEIALDLIDSCRTDTLHFKLYAQADNKQRYNATYAGKDFTYTHGDRIFNTVHTTPFVDTLVGDNNLYFQKQIIMLDDTDSDYLSTDDTLTLVGISDSRVPVQIRTTQSPKLCNQPLFPQVTTTYDCKEELYKIAEYEAQRMYKNYLDSLRQDFINRYNTFCLSNTSESLTKRSTESEYHYTLYYYDRAGNLHQTVPPAAVEPITSSTELAAVQTYRDNVAAGNPATPQLPNHNFNLASSYAYNSLNQLVEQTTPDGGTTHFWYDDMGRLVASQNARQAIRNYTCSLADGSGIDPNDCYAYSYTKYDDLGRIIEVGEVVSGSSTLTAAQVNAANWPDNIARHTQEIVQTTYDDPHTSAPSGIHQQNLRNRVATVTYADDEGSYDFATHYTYDIHGNVDTLWQEYVPLASLGRSLWEMAYDYDLVSGNVKEVAYQLGYTDQYFHRYTYDADNRITAVHTSRDGYIWDRDAAYQYYKHGPLARTELGEHNVQGLDYVYTLHGWIKGVNSNVLAPSKDVGEDGLDGGLRWTFARDAMGYSLSYYGGDYFPISRQHTEYPENYFLASLTGSGLEDASPNLWNGNIRHMVTSLTDETGTPLAPQGTAYRYDQLNRLTSMHAYQGITDNTWNSGSGALNTYAVDTIEYDPNGNITFLQRDGDKTATPLMDDFKYRYNENTNQLRYVEDRQNNDGRYDNDLDNQVTKTGVVVGADTINYTYDAIGNLVSDIAEEIDEIQWYVNGKIKAIKRTGSSTKADLYFAYGPDGQRIRKVAVTGSGSDTTWYVRDAQGNAMAIYEQFDDKMLVTERYIYGSTRVGTMTDTATVQTLTLQPDTNAFSRVLGQKQYELANHLGNVLATISDQKKAINSSGTVAYWAPKLVSYTDYMPFGMQMAGRSGSTAEARFGFNGQEKDDEVYGTGNSMTAEFWQYDARLGRRWNVDPIIVYDISNYAVFFNNPIVYLDKQGDRAWHPELNEVTGEITYIADEGDNYQTLVEQYGEKQANEIMAENFSSVPQLNSEGIEEQIQINEGDELKSSKPLKMNINSINSMSGDKKQKYEQYVGEHLIFAMRYNNYLNNLRRKKMKPIDLIDYFDGINNSKNDIRTAVFGKTTQYKARTKIRINGSYVDFYYEIPLVREYQQVESEPYKSREGPPFNGEPTIRYYFGVWGTNFNGVYMWINYRKSKELEDYASF